MKSVDPLTLLQPAAATPGEAHQKGVPDPGAGFSAILAEANHLDAAVPAAQGKTSSDKAATPQPADASGVPAVTAAREQTSAVDPKTRIRKTGQPSETIALPQQARSIHDSITRSTRGLSPRGERPGAPVPRSPQPPVFDQSAVTTTEANGATSQVAADDPFALTLGAEDPADSGSDPASLQAVLGQVASVITGIVVPPAQLGSKQVGVETTRAAAGNSEQALGAQRSSAAPGREGHAASLNMPPASAAQVSAAIEQAGAGVSQVQAAFSNALAGVSEEGASASGITQAGQPAQVATQVAVAGTAPREPRFTANDLHHAQASYGANALTAAPPRVALHAPDAGLPQDSARGTPRAAQLPSPAGVVQTPEVQPSAAQGQPFAAQAQLTALNPAASTQAWQHEPSSSGTGMSAEPPARGQLASPAPLSSTMPSAAVEQAAPRSGQDVRPSLPQASPVAGMPRATASANPARENEAPRAAPEGPRDGNAARQRQPAGVTPGTVGPPGLARDAQGARAAAPQGVVAAPVVGFSVTPSSNNSGVPATPNLSNAGAPATLDLSSSLPKPGASPNGAGVAPTSASTGSPAPVATASIALPENEPRSARTAPAKAGPFAPVVAPRAGVVRAPDSPVAQVLDSTADALRPATTAAPDATAAPAQRFVPQEQQPGVAGSPLPTAVQSATAPAPIDVDEAALSSALSASVTAPSVASAARATLKAGKPNEQTDDRIHGFTRGALFGSAVSAYAERAHGDTSHDSPARGKHTGDQANDERSAKAEPVFTLDRPQPSDPQLLAVQLQAPPPDAPPMPQAVAAPVPVPAPAPPVDVSDVVFAARPPGGQPEAASISIHHPDLGAIQLEVHRERGRVEVHAVIESVHAEAVLRANESGIRQGVQQSGMTFSALRVRVRGEEPQTARPAQARRRRADEREK